MKTKLAVLVLIFAWSSSEPGAQSVIQQLGLCTFVAPIYPAVARFSGMQGTVHVQVYIRPDGTLSLINAQDNGPLSKEAAVSVIEDNPLLRTSAIDAIRKWRFCSAKGSTQENDTTISITYRLDGKGSNQWSATNVSFQGSTEVTVTATPAEHPDVMSSYKQNQP